MRSKVEVVCSGCARPFLKLAAEVKRCVRHFCTPSCYRLNVDYRMLGKVGASVPHMPLDPAVRVARSRAGGLRRAQTQTRERLREIAMMGVEARRRFSGRRRSLIAKKAATTRRAGGLVVLGVRVGVITRRQP